MPSKPRHKSGRGAPVKLYLAPAHRQALEREAERRGVSMSQLLAEWITRHCGRSRNRSPRGRL